MSILTHLNHQIQKFKKLPQKWLYIGGLAIIATLITWMGTQPTAKTITQTRPADGDNAVPLDSTITLTFNRPLTESEQQSLIINLEPELSGFTTFNQSGDQAIFVHTKLFDPNTQYTINTIATNLREHQFTFSTRPSIDINQLRPSPASAGPPNPTDPKQKLIQSLPYRTNEFTIQYTTLGDHIYITIHQQPIDTTKQQALAWLRRQGFSDPETQLRVRYNIPNYLNPEYLKHITQ